jgi:hypothetical protein
LTTIVSDCHQIEAFMAVGAWFARNDLHVYPDHDAAFVF